MLRDPFEIQEVTAAPRVIEITDPGQWDWYQSRQERFKTHKATKTIRLRYPEEDDFQRFNRTCDSSFLKNWPALEIYKDFIDEYLEILGRHYQFTEWIAILTKLTARRGIPLHRDHGQWLSNCHRIHMPVVTNDQVFFTVGESTINMQRGVFHEIDNRNTHQVRNASSEDRIHLIIDLLPPGCTNARGLESSQGTRNVFHGTSKSRRPADR